MGSDKAFLTYKDRPFISVISEEASRVSRNVLIVIGEREKDVRSCAWNDRVISQ